jgi:hypothetical protein
MPVLVPNEALEIRASDPGVTVGPRAWCRTKLPDFDLWHVDRTQDWPLHTLILGMPEVISGRRWAA